MGSIPLPIPWADFCRAGHPPAFGYEQPNPCAICGVAWPIAAHERQPANFFPFNDDEGRYEAP